MYPACLTSFICTFECCTSVNLSLHWGVIAQTPAINVFDSNCLLLMAGSCFKGLSEASCSNKLSIWYLPIWDQCDIVLMSETHHRRVRDTRRRPDFRGLILCLTFWIVITQPWEVIIQLWIIIDLWVWLWLLCGRSGNKRKMWMKKQISELTELTQIRVWSYGHLKL